MRSRVSRNYKTRPFRAIRSASSLMRRNKSLIPRYARKPVSHRVRGTLTRYGAYSSGALPTAFGAYSAGSGAGSTSSVMPFAERRSVGGGSDSSSRNSYIVTPQKV